MALHTKYFKAMELKAITQSVQHSEGPVWDDKAQSLLYVDTFQATAYRWNYCTHTINSHKFANHNSIGVIIPIKGQNDHYVVGADRDLYTFLWPAEKHLGTHDLKKLSQVDKNKPLNQFNDGKVDSQGRIWIGTLTRNEDLSVSSSGGSLYMIDGKELTDVIEKIPNTSISNGLDWSTDNKKFYYIDSETRTVVAYDYDAISGNIDNKTVIFDLKNHPKYSGIPDGMTVDVKGNLWVALFGGKSILNIDSSGNILQEIEMPTTYVTSVCFGGPNLDILFATTSKLHLNETQLQEEPLAGCVFAIENVGTRGKIQQGVVL